jgi:hypothetical protein
MFLNDAAGNPESKSGTNICLSGKEWLKQIAFVFWLDSDT